MCGYAVRRRSAIGEGRYNEPRYHSHGLISVGGRRVAAVDRFRDGGAASMRIETIVILDDSRFLRKSLVFDLVAEPGRIVARAQVMLPGAIFDPLGDMEEQ